MKYFYCPRKTNVCRTAGPVLVPLLFQNQTITLNNTMSRNGGDVCYWEFRVNVTEFALNNPKVPLNWTYINVVIHNRTNLTTYQLNGFSDKNASNVTTNSNLSTTYKYPLSNGSSVFLIAFPPATIGGTFLNFTFNLSTDYFAVNSAAFEGVPDFV